MAENNAGGIRGLLLVQDGGNSCLPAYDGLGNVPGMIKATDGTLAAAYEYDAARNTQCESRAYATGEPTQGEQRVFGGKAQRLNAPTSTSRYATSP